MQLKILGEANSLTIEKANSIKGGEEKFTYKYDRDKNLTHYKSTDESEEEYSFKLNSVVPSHTGPIVINVKKKTDDETLENPRPALNDWVFANFFTTINMGSHEISLLQDVIKDKTVEIEAISRVKTVEGENHTYEITLNKDRLNDWLNDAYLDDTETEQDKDSSSTNDESVTLEVVLDAEEKYLVSIKTTEDFSITTASGVTYKDNKIDVKFSNIGNTEIEEPSKFLAKGDETISEDDFKTFYEECKKWHKEDTGADIYEGE